MRLTPRLKKLFREHIAPLAILILVLTSFRSAIADWNIVPSGSMNPTIVEGDRIFVNKLAYGLKVPFTTWHIAHWSEPQRGEIVVFNSPVDGTRLVKRLVALPGDTVQMIDNRLLINGQPLDYKLSGPPTKGHIVATETLGTHAHAVMATPALPARRTFGPITIPAGQYFMLGDNRDNSADSRYIGLVPRDSLLGRSSAVVMSFDPETHFPKWSRTLKTLP